MAGKKKKEEEEEAFLRRGSGRVGIDDIDDDEGKTLPRHHELLSS